MLNKIMLITYPDSMGHNLKDLRHILNRYFKDAVKMVHILPFFPSSGDRGFAPLGYEKVSEEFGDWEDIRMLSEEYPLMFDYMINHISAHSPYYQDFLEKKDQSPYRGLFIRYKDFWENGMPTQAETDAPCLASQRRFSSKKRFPSSVSMLRSICSSPKVHQTASWV